MLLHNELQRQGRLKALSWDDQVVGPTHNAVWTSYALRKPLALIGKIVRWCITTLQSMRLNMGKERPQLGRVRETRLLCTPWRLSRMNLMVVWEPSFGDKLENSHCLQLSLSILALVSYIYALKVNPSVKCYLSFLLFPWDITFGFNRKGFQGCAHG